MERQKQKGRTTETSGEEERLSESDRECERYCLTIRKGYGNIPVCVCFHPDPVGSTGAKHVTSAQAHAYIAPLSLAVFCLFVFYERKHIQRKRHSATNVSF